jgi:isoleucyl-tRNA synthetase
MGNVISPQEIIKTNGAEILRLWVAMVNYREDMRLSREVIKRVIETYRKIRNTWRFMFGVLGDFEPENHLVNPGSLREVDRYVLARMETIKEKILTAYRDYEYHVVFHTISNFFTNELSAFYLNFTKDFLYCHATGDPARRGIQTVVFQVLRDTLLLLAPILSFTAEEGWEYLPGFQGKQSSIHIHRFPEVNRELLADFEPERWQEFFQIREAIQRELETAIKEKKILRDNLQAAVHLQVPEERIPFLQKNADLLKHTLSVPELTFEKAGELKITIRDYDGHKCPRCWNRFLEESPGEDLCERCYRVTREMTVAED